MFLVKRFTQFFAFGESASQQASFQKEQEEHLKKRDEALILEAAQKGRSQDGKDLSIKEGVFIEDVLAPMVKGHLGYGGVNLSLIDFLSHDCNFANKFAKGFYSGFESNWLDDIKCFASAPSIFDLEKNDFSICHTGTKDRILALLNAMKGQIGVEETRKNLVIKRKDGTSFFPAGFLRITAPLSVDGCSEAVIKSLSNNFDSACRKRGTNDELHTSAFTKEVCSTLDIKHVTPENLANQSFSLALQLVLTLEDGKRQRSKEEIVVGFPVLMFKQHDFTDIISDVSQAILAAKKTCKQNGQELVFVTLNLFDIFVPVEEIFKANPSVLAKNFKDALTQLDKRVSSKEVTKNLHHL